VQFQREKRCSKAGNVAVIRDVQPVYKFFFKKEVKFQFSSVFLRHDAGSIVCRYVRFIVTVLLRFASTPNAIHQIHS